MLNPPRLSKPGLFVTGTDTGVGKTALTCAIGARLRAAGLRVGVSKPFATGCRWERENWVSSDAEALAHFSDCRQPLDVINPVRYGPPVAPAVAAEMTGKNADWAELWRAMRLLDDSSDVVLVEGVGGIMVPLPGPAGQVITVLDLAAALRYPVLVVCWAGLGTLNHTAMTVRLLRDAGCRIAGLAINGYEPEARDQDASMASNRTWLAKLTGCPVLAVVPRCPAAEVAPEKARLADAIFDAVAATDWRDVVEAPER